jgi:hypothetical protein
MKKHISYAAIIAVTVLLVACGQTLSGTYVGSVNVMGQTMGDMGALEFKSGSKVIMDTMGFKNEFIYEVDGKNLKIRSPEKGTMIFTIKDDGSIEGMGGVIYKKRN